MSNSYLIPAALAHLKRQIPLLDRLGPDPCSLAALRANNLVLSFSLPFLYSSLLVFLAKPRAPQRTTSRTRRLQYAAWEGLVIAGMPMLGWWAFMFYTDLASVVAVLLSWRFAVQRQYLPSALVEYTQCLQSGAVKLIPSRRLFRWAPSRSSFGRPISSGSRLSPLKPSSTGYDLTTASPVFFQIRCSRMRGQVRSAFRSSFGPIARSDFY